MQKLRESHSIATINHALRFLCLRLRSYPETADFEAPISAARTALQNADAGFTRAMEARIAASAEVAYLDALLDSAVMEVAREAAALVGDDRSDSRYTRLFPIPPATAMRPTATEAQERYVRNIIDRLSSDADLAPLASRAKGLSERLAALKGADEKRTLLHEPELQAEGLRKTAAIEARRLYNSMQAELALLLEEGGAPLESFFVDFGRRLLDDDEAALLRMS